MREIYIDSCIFSDQTDSMPGIGKGRDILYALLRVASMLISVTVALMPVIKNYPLVRDTVLIWVFVVPRAVKKSNLLGTILGNYVAGFTLSLPHLSLVFLACLGLILVLKTRMIRK